MSRVAFGALGGTIASLPDASGGQVPTVTADDLVSDVARASGIEVVAATLRLVASASIDLADVRVTLDWARRQVDDGAVGVVISQGTDTIEESSWVLDLCWDRPEPLVVTGAMRAAGEFSADGPANLDNALMVASSPGARDRGVLVTLDDQVHRARWVRKGHTSITDAFRSASGGPTAVVIEDRVHWFAPAPERPGPLTLPDARSFTEPWVPLLPFHLGDDGRLVTAALDAGAAGLVIMGAGAGHVSEPASDVIADAAARVPVVLAARPVEGPSFTRTYGYKGSEIDLLGRGLISSGWLDAWKARLLLWTLLASDWDASAIARQFDERGSLPN